MLRVTQVVKWWGERSRLNNMYKISYNLIRTFFLKEVAKSDTHRIGLDLMRPLPDESTGLEGLNDRFSTGQPSLDGRTRQRLLPTGWEILDFVCVNTDVSVCYFCLMFPVLVERKC